MLARRVHESSRERQNKGREEGKERKKEKQKSGSGGRCHLAAMLVKFLYSEDIINFVFCSTL